MKELSIPLALELFLQLIMGSVDTFMVSRLGDSAVAGVGLSNQILQAAMTLLVFINAGAGIITARQWGAGRRQDVRRSVVLLVGFNLGAGVLLGLGFLVGTPGLLGLAGIPETVRPWAQTYLTVAGSGLGLLALQQVFSTVLRSTGDTRTPLYVSLGMNGVHLGLNGGFLFGWFGFPVLGVMGTAISTLASRAAAMVVLGTAVWKLLGIRPGDPKDQTPDRHLWKEILTVGIPVSVTSVSWGFSQVALTSVVARLGPQTLAAWTYVQNLQQYPWIATNALGAALQILVAQDIGAGQTVRAQARLAKTVPRAMGVALFLAAVMAAFMIPLLGLFTTVPAVAAAAVPAMALAVLWHPLRALAFCYSGGLNAGGNPRTVAVATVLGMWFVATGGAWALSTLVPWGLAGVFLALISDEAVRGSWFAWQWGRKINTNSK